MTQPQHCHRPRRKACPTLLQTVDSLHMEDLLRRPGGQISVDPTHRGGTATPGAWKAGLLPPGTWRAEHWINKECSWALDITVFSRLGFELPWECYLFFPIPPVGMRILSCACPTILLKHITYLLSQIHNRNGSQVSPVFRMDDMEVRLDLGGDISTSCSVGLWVEFIDFTCSKDMTCGTRRRIVYSKCISPQKFMLDL